MVEKFGNTMIDLMHGCLLLVALLIILGATGMGIGTVMNSYSMSGVASVLVVGGSFLGGLIVASIITGFGFLALSINENLMAINGKLNASDSTAEPTKN